MIYVYQYGLTDIYFIFWVIIHHYVIYFIAQNVQLWPWKALSDWLLCPSNMPRPFGFVMLRSFWHYKMLWDQLVYSLPSPRINHFPKWSFLFVFLTNIYFCLLLPNGLEKSKNMIFKLLLFNEITHAHGKNKFKQCKGTINAKSKSMSVFLLKGNLLP